ECVAERGKSDRLDREQRLAATVVELGRNCEAVADAAQLAGRLEVRRELGVLDAGEAAIGELRLEACGRLGAVAAPRRCPGRPGASALPSRRAAGSGGWIAGAHGSCGSSTRGGMPGSIGFAPARAASLSRTTARTPSSHAGR